MYQLAPRFRDLGFAPGSAMLLMSLAALMGTAGKYVWGQFCDGRDPRKVAAVMMCATGAGLALGLVSGGLAMVLLFVVVYGFAMGGAVSTFVIMAAHLFGRRHFSQVFRLLAMFLALEVLGFLAMGQSFSLTGSYDAAYGIFIGLDLLGMTLVLTLPRHQLATPGPV
jgi:MFS family permease